MFALVKGYAERAADAYARAYKVAPANNAQYRQGLLEKLQGLYKIRFDKTDGVLDWATAVMSKPMPDPTSAVSPVKEETPANTTSTSTTSSTTTTTDKPAANTTTTDKTTKPATDSDKPANTTTKPTTKTKSTTKVSSKSTTKKKGTR